MYQVFCSLQSHRSPSPAPLSPLSLPPSLVCFLPLPLPFIGYGFQGSFGPNEKEKRDRQKTKDIQGDKRKRSDLCLFRGLYLGNVKDRTSKFSVDMKDLLQFHTCKFHSQSQPVSTSSQLLQNGLAEKWKSLFLQDMKNLKSSIQSFRLSFLYAQRRDVSFGLGSILILWKFYMQFSVHDQLEIVLCFS